MKRFAIVVAVTFFLLPVAAHAAPITFTGGSGGPSGLNASAVFDVTGDILSITLSNTTTATTFAPSSVLTGLFFSVPMALTPQSATFGPGATRVGGPCDQPGCSSNSNLGGEWGYQATSFPGGANKGIASSGYLTTGLPGNPGNFNGPNLDNPVSLGGINFGLVGTGYTGGSGAAGTEPLIASSVLLTLSGATGLLNSQITNVSFQYGTSLTETNVPSGPPPPAVPEPATLVLLGTALGGARLWAKRRSH